MAISFFMQVLHTYLESGNGVSRNLGLGCYQHYGLLVQYSQRSYIFVLDNTIKEKKKQRNEKKITKHSNQRNIKLKIRLFQKVTRKNYELLKDLKVKAIFHQTYHKRPVWMITRSDINNLLESLQNMVTLKFRNGLHQSLE